MFEGWNAPWEEEGGKPVPKNAKTTINAIRRGVINEFNLAQAYKTSIKDDSLAIEAYATDTDDDVKDLAIGFIEKNHTDSGVVVIYGYSWGGDTAIELAKDLDEKQINVDLLITIDAALGPFNGPAVRDRTITGNVKLNLNHYTSTPMSRIGSRGMPNRAKDSRKTTVKNIVHQGPSHGQMDEATAGASINYISDTIIGERVCE
jgi:dienelactone hydrolase